ncbi:MAG: hypothetical protein CMH05_00585 [Marinovum sp.]|jgi:uncharacterized membrane protein YuzA (DUF378 family)|nr:hypothetical protein [Marinovum sp.]|tara:strand:- start:2259 stop:2816 length:558 start_codon:yes stop_codon:yes gene_type:complete
MGNLKNSDLIEIIFWLLIAVVFFSVSFNFNQPIEIYKFGATGWPRVILALIGLAALGNLYHSFKNGSKTQKGRVGASEAPDQVHYSSFIDYIKTAWILVIPLLYAISLKPVGFYFGTPFFIALVMLAWGERRLKFILVSTLFIYGLLIALFMFILNAPLPQGNVSPFYDFSAVMLKMKTQFDQLF